MAKTSKRLGNTTPIKTKKSKKVGNISLKKTLEKYFENNFLLIAFWMIVVFFSSLITITQGFGIVRQAYDKHIRNTQLTYESLRALRPNVQIGYFITKFGDPALVNRVEFKEKGYKEYVFVFPSFNLQAITDEGDNVLSYAVTAKQKDFQPSFDIIGWETNGDSRVVTLNKTTFADLSPNIVTNEFKSYNDGKYSFYFEEFTDTEPQCYSVMGAHDFYYFEGYYIGNPGAYKSTYVGINYGGYINRDFSDVVSNPEINVDETLDCTLVNKEFRRAATINTYVSTGKFEFVPKPASQSAQFIFGADYYDTRIIDN